MSKPTQPSIRRGLPAKHAPAMRDVARLAGVAPMTVSRALSGNPSVRAETRKVVVRAANKLGYVHNFMASALLRRGSKLIAMVVPNVSNSVFAETIHGLEEVLSAEGYTLDDWPQRLLQAARRKGWCGRCWVTAPMA